MPSASGEIAPGVRAPDPPPGALTPGLPLGAPRPGPRYRLALPPALAILRAKPTLVLFSAAGRHWLLGKCLSVSDVGDGCC